MNTTSCAARRALRLGSRRLLQSTSRYQCAALSDRRIAQRRCFHKTGPRLAEDTALEAAEGRSIGDAEFFRQYKDSLDLPNTTYHFGSPSVKRLGQPVITNGVLKSITSLSESLVFAKLESGDKKDSKQIQIISRDAALSLKLKSIRLNTPIHVEGLLVTKRQSKKAGGLKHEGENNGENDDPLQRKPLLDSLEIVLSKIVPLNAIAADLHISSEHTFPPQSRHLQLRFDEALRQRLYFRSDVMRQVRLALKDFHEIETPILFKSTPEGAREFLVPTRKAGFAYALPQSPQQYKQILMASGIFRYYQFARCFRDEDLRADRQPEFTQIDMEMAYANGDNVMDRIESLIRHLYHNSLGPGGIPMIKASFPTVPLYQMTYDEAMSLHGSDKPDLRINALIHRIESVVSDGLRGMLTSIQDPVIEAFKIRLNAPPKGVHDFVRRFMDSPEAEIFRSNLDGAPGISIYDSSKPIEGLQAFGFEGAENLKGLYEKREKYTYEDEAVYESNRKFEDGDLIVYQARENLPFSGGSTVLGKLRLAIYKAALAEKLIEPDLSHRYLWVVDFPMFTLNDGVDPGQGGTAGFSATHHPFTAPKSSEDAELLLTNPLKAKAAHYDLVVNGVELGGGSRRIHNADMQKFIMRDILKMSESRINDFSHLFSALESGCPPHAGFAVGFDRLMAVLTGCESVKDVIAFPKSSKGEDMMVQSPSRITDAELATYHLALARDTPASNETENELDGNVEGTPEEKAEKIKTELPSTA